jgi:hypothetical protein
MSGLPRCLSPIIYFAGFPEKRIIKATTINGEKTNKGYIASDTVKPSKFKNKNTPPVTAS